MCKPNEYFTFIHLSVLNTNIQTAVHFSLFFTHKKYRNKSQMNPFFPSYYSYTKKEIVINGSICDPFKFLHFLKKKTKPNNLLRLWQIFYFFQQLHFSAICFLVFFLFDSFCWNSYSTIVKAVKNAYIIYQVFYFLTKIYIFYKNTEKLNYKTCRILRNIQNKILVSRNIRRKESSYNFLIFIKKNELCYIEVWFVPHFSSYNPLFKQKCFHPVSILNKMYLFKFL